MTTRVASGYLLYLPRYIRARHSSHPWTWFYALALPFLDSLFFSARPLLPMALHVHMGRSRAVCSSLGVHYPLPALVHSRGFTPRAPFALGTKGALSSLRGEYGLSFVRGDVVATGLQAPPRPRLCPVLVHRPRLPPPCPHITGVLLVDPGCLLWIGTKDGHLVELDVRTGCVTAAKLAAHIHSIVCIFRHGHSMVTLDDADKHYSLHPRRTTRARTSSWCSHCHASHTSRRISPVFVHLSQHHPMYHRTVLQMTPCCNVLSGPCVHAICLLHHCFPPRTGTCLRINFFNLLWKCRMFMVCSTSHVTPILWPLPW
ncbi:hypothetical protein B0H14DRAFT_1413397 [Mycena olivaceomarginata]|nr:hypothetical protein B0H14DRAFT_1413397 [Mycena olivaceomarginata]